MQPKSGSARPQRLRWFAAALSLLVGVLVVYGRVGSFDFVLLDDNAYVYGNESVAKGLSPDSIRWAFTQAHSNNWHPLTWMSHMLDVDWFGMDPGPQHWVNVGFHGISVLLLFWLCARMGLGLFGAWLVAALFGWHPLRVESVAWISERKDVLSGVFGLLTLHAYLSYGRHPFGAQSNGNRPPRIQSSAVRYALVGLSLGLGLLAKPMLVSLPIVFLLLDLWPLQRWNSESTRRLCLEKVPFLLLACASALVTVVVQKQSGAVQSFEAIPMLPRLENAAWSVLVYPAQTLVPHGLGVLYPHPAFGEGGVLLHVKAVASVLVIVLATLGAWRWRARCPGALVGWFWYLVMLAPVSGVIQVGEQAHADRYTYLPTIGLFLVLVFCLRELLARRPTWTRPTTIAAVLCLLVYAELAREQTESWRNTETLFRRSNAITGGNYTAHLNLGMWLRENDRLEEALTETRAAVELKPTASMALYNLGVQESAAGRVDLAMDAFQRAIQSDPSSADAHNRVAQLEYKRGNLDAAAEQFALAVEYAPDRFDLQSNLARFLAASGDLKEARAPFERALELSPEIMTAQDQQLLARARAADGDAAGASRLLRRLRAERPSDPAPALDLAWILATSDREDLRDPSEALVLVNRLLAAPRAPRASLLPLKAAALAAQGDFSGAIRTQTEALDLVSAALRDLEMNRLESYRNHRPLRLASPW